MDKRNQAVPTHMIAQGPEVVPYGLLQFDADSGFLNLETEIFLQCPHVNSASGGQPALIVVQLMSDSACMLLLHRRCNLNPSSFGLYPVLELPRVIRNFGSACREPIRAPISTQKCRGRSLEPRSTCVTVSCFADLRQLSLDIVV